MEQERRVDSGRRNGAPRTIAHFRPGPPATRSDAAEGATERARSIAVDDAGEAPAGAGVA